jgi:hypothetical protein
MRRILFAFSIALSATRAVHAQPTTLSSLRAGDTIRVWAVAPRLNGQPGTFDSAERDTLRFMNLGQLPATPIAVGYPALHRIDVKRGTHRSAGRIVIGSVLGVALGTIAGGYIGVAAECGRTCGDSGDFEGLAGFLAGGALGAVAGGVTGGVLAARHRAARWDAVDLRR